MEIDPFGFIEDFCRIPKAQESILRKFPFPRKGCIDGVGGDELEEEDSPDCFELTESTKIMILTLPVSPDEEAEEEYHTPRENSSVIPSSDEAAGEAVGAESVVDLARDGEGDVSQDVLEFGKGGEANELIVSERKIEKTRALRRKEGSPGSLRSKSRIALGLSDSSLDLDGGNVPGSGRDSYSGILDHGFNSSRASKGRSVYDECLQELQANKLKKAEKNWGIMSENMHSDALGAGLMEVDREMREYKISKGVDASGGSRREFFSRVLKSLEKAGEDNISGAFARESNGRLKRTAVDSEFGGTLVDNSVKMLRSSKNSGSTGVVKGVANGNSEAIDFDGRWKESPVKRMKILEVNLQVETPSSSVEIVEEKIRELLKSIEKLNPNEVIAEGSSMRMKSIKDSNCEDTIRIIDLEVSERHDGPVVDENVENDACCGEDFAGNERHKDLAQTSIEEIDKFGCTAKSFSPHNKGKRKCPGEGSGTIDGEVTQISKSRDGICAGHTDVLNKSSSDAQGLMKLPPSIMGQSTDKDSRKGNQSQAPPSRLDIPPQEDEIIDLVPSTLDARPPPRVSVPDIMEVMKMITAAHVETLDGTESLLDIAKRHGMNLPRPRWWGERNFELG